MEASAVSGRFGDRRGPCRPCGPPAVVFDGGPSPSTSMSSSRFSFAVPRGSMTICLGRAARENRSSSSLSSDRCGRTPDASWSMASASTPCRRRTCGAFALRLSRRAHCSIPYPSGRRRVSAERGNRHACLRGARASRAGAGVHGAAGLHRPAAVRACGRRAATRGDCSRDGRQARVVALDDPTTGLDPITATTVDDEIVKLRDLERVTSIAVTHQIRDAFYVAGHNEIRPGGRVQIGPGDEGDSSRVNFMVLNGGRIQFEGSVDLRTSSDRYVREFLLMTLSPGMESSAPIERAQGLAGGAPAIIRQPSENLRPSRTRGRPSRRYRARNQLNAAVGRRIRLGTAGISIALPIGWRNPCLACQPFTTSCRARTCRTRSCRTRPRSRPSRTRPRRTYPDRDGPNRRLLH